MLNKHNFENIYTDYNRMVYNLCLNYVLNTEDAQDCTQEIFVKIYYKLKQFNDSKASLKTWIYRITVNHCIDKIKAKKSQKRFSFLSTLFNSESNEPLNEVVNFNHPGINIEEKEGLEKLLKIIYKLPDNQKTAIILSKIEDRTQKEVAEIMGVSIKSLEGLLQRAKKNIATNIDKAKD